MSVPHDIESDLCKTFFHMIEAREGDIELLVGVVGKTRAIARDEAVFASPPLAEDVYRIIEGSRATLRQEPGFQDFGDEALACRSNGRLLLGSENSDPHPSPLPLRHSQPLLFDAAPVAARNYRQINLDIRDSEDRQYKLAARCSELDQRRPSFT
jgi:hypothetical protein